MSVIDRNPFVFFRQIAASRTASHSLGGRLLCAYARYRPVPQQNRPHRARGADEYAAVWRNEMPGRAGHTESYMQYLSSQAKNSRFQWMEFWGLRIQWFSSGKRIIFDGTPIIWAALKADIPCSTGTR